MVSAMPVAVARRRRGAWMPAALLSGLVAAASSVLAQAPAAPPTLPALDRAVSAAIAAAQTPGAVVLVGQGPQTLHLQAYGLRGRAGKPVEDVTVAAVFFRRPFLDELNRQLVGDQLSPRHNISNFLRQWSLSVLERPENISGRYLRQMQSPK